MSRWRSILILMLISCLIPTGCQLDPPAKTVGEYRPSNPPTEYKAPDSEVIVLWRWQPVSPSVNEPATRSVKQFAVEVQQVHAERDSPLGFRQSTTQLLAVAGSTLIPIDDAHYNWRTYPGSCATSENRRTVFDKIATGAIAFFIASNAAVIVAVAFFLPADRHTLSQDISNAEARGSVSSVK